MSIQDKGGGLISAGGGIYAFFFVGNDISQPQMLVDSIRWVDSQAEIVHCADAGTPQINGVSRRVDVDGDRRRLMTYRLRAFRESGINRPAIYIDTDMLCVRPIDAAALCREHPIRFCARQFSVDAGFNGRFGGMDFMEYDGHPLGQVYPFVACATVAPDSGVWASLGRELSSINPKFSIWYGDQEAMRLFAERNGILPSHGLPETVFGCLPEQSEYLSSASLIHFKGAARKGLMSDFYSNLRLRNLQNA